MTLRSDRPKTASMRTFLVLDWHCSRALDGNSELTSDDGKYSFIISGVGPRRILGPNSMRVLSTKPAAALGLCGGGSLRFHTYDSNGKVIGDNKHYPPLGGVIRSSPDCYHCTILYTLVGGMMTFEQIK